MLRRFKLPRLLEIFLGVALLCLPFAHILFSPGRFLASRDLLTGFLPAKTIWARIVREEGWLPTWNPYHFAGTPYWADLKSAVLYPMNVLFLFLEPSFALTWFVFLHVALMAVGMRAFLLSLGLESGAALLGACLYALSGQSLSSISSLNLLAAMAALPFFALFAERWRKELPPIWSGATLGLVFFVSLPFYAGSPELSFLFSLYLLGSALRKPSKRRILSLTAIGGAMLCLCAAILIPGLEHWRGTSRAIGALTESKASLYHFHPARMAEFLLLLPFGNYVPELTYWGGRFTSHPYQMPLFFSQYLGAGAAVGAIGFFLSSKKLRGGMILFAFLCLLISFGTSAPLDLNGFLFRFLPGWNTFKSPEKLMIPFAFFLLVAQAFGWQMLFEDVERKGKKTILALLGSCALAMISFFIVQSLAATETTQLDSLRYFFPLTLALALVLLAIRLRPALRPYRWALLLLVLGGDLCVHARALIWDQPRELLQVETAEEIQSHLASHATELNAGAAFRYAAQNRAAEAIPHSPPGLPLDVVGQVAQSNLFRLLPATPALYGIHDIAGGGAMPNAAKMALLHGLFARDAQKLLNLTGVAYIGEASTRSPYENKLRVNADAVPYLMIPERIMPLAQGASALEALASPSFREGRDVLLEGIFSEANLPKGGSVRVLEKTSRSLKVETNGVALLVRNESYDPHWKASVNGQLVKIQRANGWSMAVSLGECRNGCTVEFRYENWFIWIGLAVTLGFVLVCFAGWMRGRSLGRG